MPALKNQQLYRFVKIALKIVYGLLMFASVFLVIWIVLSPILVSSSGLSITASVPVAIGEGAEPQFEVDIRDDSDHKVQNAFVDEAQGVLRLETTNWVFILISNLSKLLTAVMLAYVFYLLRYFFESIEQGSPFTKENCERIRRLGVMVLLVSILRPLFENIAANEILNQLSIAPALSLPSPFKAEAILAGMLILVIAQIWSYGLELERDQELTV